MNKGALAFPLNHCNPLGNRVWKARTYKFDEPALHSVRCCESEMCPCHMSTRVKLRKMVMRFEMTAFRKGPCSKFTFVASSHFLARTSFQSADVVIVNNENIFFTFLLFIERLIVGACKKVMALVTDACYWTPECPERGRGDWWPDAA